MKTTLSVIVSFFLLTMLIGAVSGATFSAPAQTKPSPISNSKPTSSTSVTSSQSQDANKNNKTTKVPDDGTSSTVIKNEGLEPVFFGAHMHRIVLRSNETQAYVPTQWPSSNVKIGSLRLWDSTTRWADIAPKAGVWNFDRLDAYVAKAQANGAEILYTLGSTPQWASARPYEVCPYGFGCSAEPVRLAHWEEYVRRVVTRYKGRIKAYEIWNEPKFSDIPRDRGAHAFFTGSVKDMVALASSAYKIIKEIDPDALVLTPGFTNGADRLDMYLKAGGVSYVDGITYHFYASSAKEMFSHIHQVRQVMENNGVSHLPLWNTEDGVFLKLEGPQTMAGEKATISEVTALAAQHFIISAASNIQRLYYYAWDNINSGMVNPQGGPMPLFNIMVQMQSWLMGTKVAECTNLAASTYACEAVQNGQSYIFAWSDRPGGYKLTLPTGFFAVGMQSADLSVAPITIPKTNILNVSLSAMPVRIRLETQ
ncbi:endo-1,4-beta-xylanase [Methylobacillus sp.]|uniref:endo-1,4-beta-xylanase n=1 Tax=Methylobacillus sp. TaxID=56818 RepID=UPI002FE1E70F